MTLLAFSKLKDLESLRGAELIVYIRLIAAVRTRRSRSVTIKNAALHSAPRTAAAAIASLRELGLIKVRFDDDANRVIEVL